MRGKTLLASGAIIAGLLGSMSNSAVRDISLNLAQDAAETTVAYLDYVSTSSSMLLTDSFYETELEKKLESEYDLRIFSDEYNYDKRSAKVWHLSRLLSSLRENWDCFPIDDDIVDTIDLRVGGSQEIMGTSIWGRFYITNENILLWNMTESTLVHEYAHGIYYDKKSKIDAQWGDIERKYAGWIGKEIDPSPGNAFITKYASTNIAEDVAELTEAIYNYNYGLADYLALAINVPKLRKKVDILVEFNFVSETEAKRFLSIYATTFSMHDFVYSRNQ